MGIATKAAEKFEPPARKEEEPVELPPEVGDSETKWGFPSGVPRKCMVYEGKSH